MNALQMVSFVFDIVLIVFAVSWFMDKKCDGELKWRRGKKISDSRLQNTGFVKKINRKS